MKALGLLSFLLVLFFVGCGGSADSRSAVKPAALTSGDECHLCGMLIQRFPGPKGQLVVQGDTVPRKFCSTRDLFSYALQPEIRDRIAAVYVHDMGRNAWPKPDAGPDAFTDGRTAWYVVGHDRKGAMGHTLASFARRSDAEAFAAGHGGRILGFDDITLALLADLAPHGD
ncbi:MAG: nitrous oxide reductase accessory protein NosL [Ectothiorhodospiraceae bacterium]